MRAVRLLVIGLVSGLLVVAGLVAAGSPPAAAGDSGSAARAEQDIKDVTVNLEFPHQERAETGGGYGCATGIFAPFVDMPGWDARLVTWMQVNFPGNPAYEVTKDIYFEQPYEDSYSIAGYSFPAAPGTHHALLPATAPVYTSSLDDANARQTCAQQVPQAKATYGLTAKITYVRDQGCEQARGKLDEAKAKVKAAKQKVKNTTGPAHTAAVAALSQAKAKLKKAKKKEKQKCPK